MPAEQDANDARDQKQGSKAGTRAMTRTRGAWYGVLGTAFAAVLLHAWHFGHTCDDAYISFRYARNLYEGLGLVYNPGERVMGYSNFLWVVFLAGARALGVDILLASRLLGTVFTWATLALVGFQARRWALRPATAALVLGLLVANGTFALWMFGGLEGPLFACLLTASVVTALSCDEQPAPGRFLLLGSTLGLAALTRPEGIFYSVPICGWVLFRLVVARYESGRLEAPHRAGGREPGNGRQEIESGGTTGWPAHRSGGRAGARRILTGVLLALGIAAACYLGMTLWMVAYYGDPLPNTYYAKAHPVSLEVLSRGWLFTRRFLEAYHLVPAGIVLWWTAATRLSPRARGWLPLGVIAAFVVFFLATGGDALVYHRMWLWTLPMFALLAAEAIACTWRTRAERIVVTICGITAVALSLPDSFAGEDIAYLREDDRFLADLVVLGRSLEANTPEDTLIAANNIGVLGYESRRRILDMLGLVDRHIARAPGKPVATPGHESHDGAYVLERRPDLIFLGMPRVVAHPARLQDDPGRLYPSDVDLIRDARFRRGYRFRNLVLMDGRYAPVFARVPLSP